MFSIFFIRRPIFASVVSFFVVILGLVGFALYKAGILAPKGGGSGSGTSAKIDKNALDKIMAALLADLNAMSPGRQSLQKSISNS